MGSHADKGHSERMGRSSEAKAALRHANLRYVGSTG